MLCAWFAHGSFIHFSICFPWVAAAPSQRAPHRTMKALTPARSLVDRAYDALLDAICTGELRPGERVAQDEVAERLQVSRQPVNSALAMLRAQGFVLETGRRGVVVAPVNPLFFKAIYQVRSALEPLAVELATPRLDDDAIARGRATVARGKALVEAGDASGVLQADIDFHTLIYELSGNPVLLDTMRLNWLHLRRSMGEVLRFPGMSAQVWTEHAEILETMIRRTPTDAATLMRRHIQLAVERVSCPRKLE
jgi:DNA-binding GntR family transcriptional regulator